MPEVEPEAPVYELPEDRVDDPREHAEWFRRLPESARDELRDRWRAAERRGASVVERRRDTWRRYVLECVVLFWLAVVVYGPWSFVSLVVATFVGAAAGAAAARLRAGAHRYPWLVASGYLVFTVLTGYFHLLAFLGIVSFAALLGFSHEQMRQDGREA